MISKVKTTTIYNCTLERAFKTPMLCDITKVHTGFLFTPKVTHTTKDENWGKPGFHKNVFAAKSFWQQGGYIFDDKVLEREENKYWKIEVSNFQTYMFGFTKFVGVWKTTKLDTNQIQIDYSYELHSNHVVLFPFNWLFAKFFWRMYMKKVLENIRVMITSEEDYLFI